MDLNNKILHVFETSDGRAIWWITESMRSTWVIMGILIVFAVIVRVCLNNFKDVPKGFQNVVEMMVETFDGFVKNAAGPKLAFLGNWFFMVFAFILLSNIIGIIPFFGLRPPTADWVVTFSFAFCTFVLIQVLGVKYQKGKYFKNLLEPFFLFLPLNIIGELARPVSLSFRLFGNILSGYILSSLLYALAPALVLFGAPVIIHVYFDLFAGAIQTYIFCMLSLMFISTSASVEGDQV